MYKGPGIYSAMAEIERYNIEIAFYFVPFRAQIPTPEKARQQKYLMGVVFLFDSPPS